MNLHLFLAYCLATAVLLLVPGPIVTLIVANSLGHGSRSGLATVAGASAGNLVLLVISGIGLVAFFAFVSEIIEIVRWAGAAYLIWLGINAWRVPGTQGPGCRTAAKPSWRRVFLQGFLVAMTNPKAIVFYIAFLPQFVDARLPVGPQLAILVSTMTVMGLLSDGAYALLAARARGWLAAPGRRQLHGRISGTLLIGVGCALLLARWAS